MVAPFYNPSLSYEDNYRDGPFGTFALPVTEEFSANSMSQTFLGHTVRSTIGIPAGPLLNSRYVEAAFAHGFDLCVYKTVRSRAHPCHPFPNIQTVLADGDMPAAGAILQTVPVDTLTRPVSITNSFGVPSQSPDSWQPDMAQAVSMAGVGQLLIGSFQGSGEGDAQIRDYAVSARLVAETGAPVLEANLSCPNEGKHGLLCFDLDKVEAIVDAIRVQVPDRPLMLKLAYFEDVAQLQALVRRIAHKIDGLCTVNTLSARVVDANGMPSLPGKGRDMSGVCGATIRWAGLAMMEQLARIRAENGLDFAIIGSGGVLTAEDDKAYRQAGADAVMSATGAMWNTSLALQIKKANIAK